MATIESLQKKYGALEKWFDSRKKGQIDPSCLLSFDYEYHGKEAEVVIDTSEFTAVCPWTYLPDFGTLTVNYVPTGLCFELKSLKYYLMSYAGVSIVQEHAANHILNDLVAVCRPLRMTVKLEYNVRGGLHTCVIVRYENSSE